MPNAKLPVKAAKTTSFKEGGEAKSKAKPYVEGEVSSSKYGTGGGGRLGFRKSIDKDTDIDTYLEGGGFKPKGGEFKGKVTGAGVKLTKRFATGGEAKSKVNAAGNYTKPELRKRIFNAVKALRPPQAQALGNGQPEKPRWLLNATKKLAAGTETNMKAPQKSLKDWGDQKWRTKSGKKSSETGERYLPSAAIKSLSPAEYAATTRAKRAGKAAGKQFVKQPKKIAKKTAGFR
jgi:hypothetical protein